MSRTATFARALTAFGFCAALLFSYGAGADPIGTASGKLPGCDSRIMDAMGAKANARVAYDVATTEQIVDKPDSILAMTCFNDAAGESAVQIGSMFSGDFTTQLGTIIPDSLQAFYDDFQGAPGYDQGTIDYTQTALGTSITSCNYVQDLWTQIEQEGVQKNIPYPLYTDFLTGNQPAGGDTVLGGSNFDKDWNQSSSDGDFSNVTSAINALPVANTPTFMSAPVNTDDECAVLGKIGISGATCP